MSVESFHQQSQLYDTCPVNDGNTQLQYQFYGGVDPQSPAYIFGERVIRPIIDRVCEFSWRSPSSRNFFDRVISVFSSEVEDREEEHNTQFYKDLADKYKHEASNFYRKDKKEDAIVNYCFAIECYRESGLEEEAIMLFNHIYKIIYQKGDYSIEEIIEDYRQVVRNRNSEFSQGDVDCRIVIFYKDFARFLYDHRGENSENLSRATKIFEEALDMAEEKNCKEWITTSLKHNLASCYKRKKEFEKSSLFYNECIELYTNNNRNKRASDAARDLGRLIFDNREGFFLERVQESVQAFTKSITNMVKIPDFDLVRFIETVIFRSRSLAHVGQAEKALADLEIAMDILEAVLSSSDNSLIEDLTAKISKIENITILEHYDWPDNCAKEFDKSKEEIISSANFTLNSCRVDRSLFPRIRAMKSRLERLQKQHEKSYSTQIWEFLDSEVLSVQGFVVNTIRGAVYNKFINQPSVYAWNRARSYWRGA